MVIEFVGREDEMVQALLANREDQYDDYTLESFRSLLADRFPSATKRRSRAASARSSSRNPADTPRSALHRRHCNAG